MLAIKCILYLHPFLNAQAENEDKVIKIVFSSNGYHLGTAHSSGAVRVWDMRKEKLVKELNTGELQLKSVTDLAFHPDGKHLAYGGQGGVHITMVKEWKVLAQLDVKVATGLLWDHNWIASSSDKGRTVTFHEQEEG
jgi:WD40 repeat protein